VPPYHYKFWKADHRTHDSCRNGGRFLPSMSGGFWRACRRHVACAFESSSGRYIDLYRRLLHPGIYPLQEIAFHWLRPVIYLQAKLRGLSRCSVVLLAT
jgi:hypothetical protein